MKKIIINEFSVGKITAKTRVAKIKFSEFLDRTHTNNLSIGNMKILLDVPVGSKIFTNVPQYIKTILRAIELQLLSDFEKYTPNSENKDFAKTDNLIEIFNNKHKTHYKIKRDHVGILLCSFKNGVHVILITEKNGNMERRSDGILPADVIKEYAAIRSQYFNELHPE